MQLRYAKLHCYTASTSRLGMNVDFAPGYDHIDCAIRYCEQLHYRLVMNQLHIAAMSNVYAICAQRAFCGLALSKGKYVRTGII